MLKTDQRYRSLDVSEMESKASLLNYSATIAEVKVEANVKDKCRRLVSKDMRTGFLGVQYINKSD